MRDSDVRAVLDKIAIGKEIAFKIEKPYTLNINGKVYRKFDKRYSLDGLTVFVEAELGRKKTYF